MLCMEMCVHVSVCVWVCMGVGMLFLCLTKKTLKYA